MTPFPTPAEITLMQERCQAALEKAKTAEGLEKMRLLNEAFPFALTGGDSSSLRFSWHPKEMKWTVCDSEGFLTLIEKEDVSTMLIAIGMEAAKAGSFRSLITGKERRQEPPKAKRFGAKLTLEDIGLGKKE